MKKKKKEIKVELIPVYIPHAEFLEKKAEIQNLIAKILINDYKEETKKKSSTPATSDLDNG